MEAKSVHVNVATVTENSYYLNKYEMGALKFTSVLRFENIVMNGFGWISLLMLIYQDPVKISQTYIYFCGQRGPPKMRMSLFLHQNRF